jgi:thymidylate kinase
MQIELIGCTSAGKSTLARRILEVGYKRGIDIVLGEDFILQQVRLNWIKGSLFRKLLVNLVALFASLVTWRINLETYRFAARFLFQLPIAQLEKLNTLKNVLKRIGIYEIIRHRSADRQVILIDEGVLQAAHYLFVHVSAQVETEHLSIFAGLIPLPDAVVYVKQPEALLIDRTMKRGHKRIPDRSHDNVARFIEKAVAVFDYLAKYPAVENRLLVVDGDRNIHIASKDQDAPTLGLALQIIQKGFTNNTSETRTENTHVPGLNAIATASNSLLEKGS